MNSQPKRPYRENLTSHGLIYMGEKEHEVTVQNLSITGALAELNNNWHGEDIKHIFNILSVSTTVDLYLPELRLAGEAEVVRADTTEDNHIVLGLEFKDVAYYVDKWQFKRKAYRKNLSDVGHILLNGEYYDFISINVSVDGLMIHITESIAVEEGTVTQFEFKRLRLHGDIKVIWVDTLPAGTFIGLQYLNIQKDDIRGVPCFYK